MQASKLLASFLGERSETTAMNNQNGFSWFCDRNERYEQQGMI